MGFKTVAGGSRPSDKVEGEEGGGWGGHPDPEIRGGQGAGPPGPSPGSATARWLYILSARRNVIEIYWFANQKPYLFNIKSHLSCVNTGEHCETISECSVPCEHGRCTHKPDVCECETNWGPPGNCSIYEGPCFNCSSEGGTCKDGPNTCKCKPGMNNDTQCPLSPNEFLVQFPVITIILVTQLSGTIFHWCPWKKPTIEYRRVSSPAQGPLWSWGAKAKKIKPVT